MWIRGGRAKLLMNRKVLEVSSLSLSFSFFLCLCTYLPNDLSVYLSICVSIYLSIYLSLSLSHLITYLSSSLFHLITYLSIYLSLQSIMSRHRILPMVPAQSFVSCRFGEEHFDALLPRMWHRAVRKNRHEHRKTSLLRTHRAVRLCFSGMALDPDCLDLHRHDIQLYFTGTARNKCRRSVTAQPLSICLSVYLSIYCLCLVSFISQFVLASNYLSMCLCIYLSISPSFSLAVSLTIYQSAVCPSIYVSSCLSIYLSIYLSVCLSICLSIYLSMCLSISLWIDLCIYRSIDLSIDR